MNEKFKSLDYVILILVLFISVLIGLFHELKLKLTNLLKKYKLKPINKVDTQNFELKANIYNEIENENKTNDYLTGSSSIGSIPIAFSLLATYFSATSLLGIPAEIYQYGIQFWMVVFGMMLTPVCLYSLKLFY